MEAQEIWKDVVGYEGKYLISSMGNVYSIITGKELKPCLSPLYHRVTLSNNKIKNRITVHRLVAMHFIPNPNNKPCVNHINGTKTDNRVENLEWCTYSENVKHSFAVLGKKIVHSEDTKDKIRKAAIGRDMTKAVIASAAKRKGLPAANIKGVICTDKSGNHICTYPSLTDAYNITGISKTAISNCLNNRSKTAGGFKWVSLTQTELNIKL